MRFRFVHAADLHLDSPMRGLSARQPHLAALFGEATRKAFIALVDRTIALEAAFLVIARDPVRFRPLMVPAVLEKAAFGLPAIALFAVGRISGQVLAFGLIDLALGVLFVVSYVRTAQARIPGP